MKKCQELIDKVSEYRHSKIKQRQINKLNRLIEKEGNITWSASQGSQASASPWAARASSPHPGNTLPQAASSSSSQAGMEAGPVH